MAVSAAAVTAKLVALTLSDRNGRTVFFSVIAALVTPVILIVTMILCTLSGTVDHNISAVQLSFHGGYLSSKVPAEYRMYIENMQDSFEKLDGVLNEINGMAEAEEVDPYQVKAIFYALFFGKEHPRMDEGDYRAFADCFVEYEEREDEEGETYTVAIPIQSLNMVYGNLAAELNQEVSLEDKTNVQRIYMLAKYGVSVPGGNGLPPGQAMGDGSFSALMAEATRYIGYPYVWGGASPSTSFDCSGFVSWVINNCGNGWNVGRQTADGLRSCCAYVPPEQAKPGDLIFFQGTYDTPGASHVGIYVGNQVMIHCGDPIQYANISTPYWQQHFMAFGRLP